MVNKKKVLVACGTGIATSIAVARKVEDILKQKGYGDKVTFSTCSVAELVSKASSYDLIITTAQNNKQLPTKVILGVVFLTGRGMDPVINEIVEYLGLNK